MTGYNLKGRYHLGRSGKKHHGFTLVELIVVLAIIAILAAAGVFAAVGFINRSKFDQNSQNAITIYQTTQSALSEKSMNGTMDEWVSGMAAFKGGDLFDSTLEAKLLDAKEANRSINRTIALTYNPQSATNPEDKYLYELLRGSFYDMTVFNGTMAVELDITATYGNGKINYSARVLSAFYSRENNIASGWDSVRKGKGYVPEDPELQYLPEAKGSKGYLYRRNTSYVGWFNGTSESITAPAGVLPVFLPQSKVQPLEGHIVAGEQNGYLFNLRNGETLDVSWAIFDYDGTARKNHNEDIVITLNSAEDHDPTVIRGNDTSDNKFYDGVQIFITPDALSDFLSSVEPKPSSTVKENVNGIYDITRISQDGFIKAKVVRTENGTSKTYTNINFPLTVTLVKGDGRKGTSRDTNGNLADYYEFRLSLDAMMVRADETTSDPGWNHYGIDRLFGYTHQDDINRLNPRNIYATLHGSWNYTKANGSNGQEVVSDSEPTEAARAIDDPVYLTNVRQTNGVMTYIYFVEFNSGLGRYDEQDSMNSETDNVITGRCVVNSLFGDLNYSNSYDPADADAISGTFWGPDGGNAVITSYRHLYNIRKVIEEKTATFRIVKNLDWYIHDTVMVNGTMTELYTSEVKVFKTGLDGYNSPVMGNQLKVVSFPAFKELKAGLTLASMSKSDGKIYSINNLQMRADSFISSNTDKSEYGLFCKNNGTIFNIYTNNFNFVFVKVNDGSDNDYKSICPDDPVTYSFDDNNSSNPVNRGNSLRVGALVGGNYSNLGSTDPNIPDNMNTIRMSNTILMVGSYWKAWKNCDEVGGVVGRFVESGSTSGVIEFKGTFAVVSGGKNTAGIIGNCLRDNGARLVVDGEADSDKSEFDLPINSVTNEKMSCVIAGRGNVAGAVAWFEGKSLTHSVGTQLSPDDISVDADTGKMSFPEMNDNDYQIDVYIPENGLIIKNGTYDDSDPSRPIAGAIARWTKGTGSYASIRVRNDGFIVATDTSKNVYCGGAVGREDQSAVGQVYIAVDNGRNSRIGSMSNTSGPVAAGGAYGRIEGARAGTIMINAVNNGSIISRGTADGTGTGGAIGGVLDNVKANYFVNVVNNSQSQILGVGSGTSSNCGTGGAIGGMHSSNNNAKISGISVVSAENHGLISGQDFVGGAIGNAVANEGRICSVIMEGCSINGSNFVGGTAGRVSGLSQSSGFVKTVVRASATVYGSGSVIGGVIGDAIVTGTGNNGKVELAGEATSHVLTVRGGDSSDGVGGVVGVLRSSVVNNATVLFPNQSETNKLVIDVEGRSNIGGAIGKLRAANVSSNTASEVLDNGTSAVNISIKLSVALNPQSKIIGTGSSVGGAIGYVDGSSGAVFDGSLVVRSTAGSSSDGESVIKGELNVGGAVGQFGAIAPYHNSSNTAKINVDFSSHGWIIKSTRSAGENANVGGAVGFFNGGVNIDDDTQNCTTGKTNNSFAIDVNLGSSTVISEGANVGGAIGKNLIRNGIITVTFAGLVKGGSNVGGAIGINRSDLNAIRVTILGSGNVIAGTDADIGSGELSAPDDYSGTNAGGAVGYNFSRVQSEITVNISGKVIGYGNNVGGAIGFCYAIKASPRYWIEKIEVTLEGESEIHGYSDNVGGALGYTLGDITYVKTNITGKSTIEGVMRVGGVVGYASAGILKRSASEIGGNGSDILKSGPGYIKYAEVIVSADEALKGTSRIGGVVGEAGYKRYINDGATNTWTAPQFGEIRAEINAATLFDPENTGYDDPTMDAMVGGVIGHYCDGTVANVVFAGNGGAVELDYPKYSLNHAVLIQAKGRAVGGIVGQIGNENLQQNCFLSKIEMEDGGPLLCVVSGNGADRIGGWIGSGNGAGGGIGYQKRDQFITNPATYYVNNVVVVYSEGSYVGGFCGHMDALSRNGKNAYQGRYTFAIVDVTLDGATIMGKSCVGGAIGGMGHCTWFEGSITVNARNHTNIGDVYYRKPGDTTAYDRICDNAGGAIGYVYGRSGRTSEIYIPINVTIDDTSCVSGLAEDNSENGGVGGAFGRANYVYLKNQASNTNGSGGNSQSRCQVHVNTDDTIASVCSTNNNVGGFAGTTSYFYFRFDANYTPSHDEYYSTNAYVSFEEGEEACVGGFIGKMSTSTPRFAYSTGKVISEGNKTRAGGFVGAINNAGGESTIYYSYTTSTVSSVGTSTGGFIGVIEGNSNNKVSIHNSYVGGHTYNGQFVSNEHNISGIGNVGGFVGEVNITSGSLYFYDLYTTASVTGTGNNIGGFIGDLAVKKGEFKLCYSAGRVVGNYTSAVGGFAGHLADINNSRFVAENGRKSMVLTGINEDSLTLVGTVGDAPVDDVSISSHIIISDANGIKGNSTGGTAYPFDNYLMTDTDAGTGEYPLRAVINNEHYGDWPVPSSEGISIGNASVVWRSDILNSEGIPEFVYNSDLSEEKVKDYITVTVGDNDLFYGTDYELKVEYNDRVGDVSVIITGKGSYIGSVMTSLSVVEADITNAVVSLKDGQDRYEYTGAAVVPNIIVTYKYTDSDGVEHEKELNGNTDYYLSYVHENLGPGNNTKIGKIEVTVTGTGNYTGTAIDKREFYIVGMDLSQHADIQLINASAAELIYDGSPKEPDLVVRSGNKTLVRDVDYTVSYENNVDVGTDTAKVIINAVDGSDYSGFKDATFSIGPATNRWVTEPAIEGWTYGVPKDPVGEALGGSVVYTYYTDAGCNNMTTDETGAESEGGRPANTGTYYMKASVELEANINSTDEVKYYNYLDLTPEITSFTITSADISGVTVTCADQRWTGSPVELETDVDTGIIVKDGDDQLEYGKDYTITYPEDITSVGTVDIVINGMGNYTGTASGSYEIIRHHVITFDTHQESVTVEPQDLLDGETVTEPVVDEVEGQVLEGWYFDAEYSQRYDFAIPLNENSDVEITLHGKWVPKNDEEP